MPRLLLSLAFLFLGPPWVSSVSAAPSPSQLCESAMELASAKYAQCRLTAQSKDSKAPNPTKLIDALGRCSQRLSDAFARTTLRYGAACAATEPSSAFDAYLKQCSDDTVAAASGSTFPDCAGDLSTCNGDLDLCGTDLSSCASNLTTAQGNLATCNANLSATQATLTATQGGLTTCNDDLSATQASLSTCNGSLTATQGDLTTCEAALAACVATPTPTAMPTSTPTPSPTETPLPTPYVVADSVADFSSVQGQAGWVYGYYATPPDSGTFQQILVFEPTYATPSTEGAWLVNKLVTWAAIWQTGQHPGAETSSCGKQVTADWTVRRWVSDVSGQVRLAGHVGKQVEGFDGAIARIIVDGSEIYTRNVAGSDLTGVDYEVFANVDLGSHVDFVVSPHGSDCNDSIGFTAVIEYQP